MLPGVMLPFLYNFTDTSGNAAEWTWDFGDGNGSNEQNPVHTYHEAGNYTVRLTVRNADGTGSKTSTINVFQRLVYAYVTNSGDNTVSVIDTATNTVTAAVAAGNSPYEISASRQEQRYMWQTGEAARFLLLTHRKQCYSHFRYWSQSWRGCSKPGWDSCVCNKCCQ
jgi:YVTN family beta-propeller protein